MSCRNPYPPSDRVAEHVIFRHMRATALCDRVGENARTGARRAAWKLCRFCRPPALRLGSGAWAQGCDKSAISALFARRHCLMVVVQIPMPARKDCPDGHVAEWLRNGLQNRVPRFNSGRGLQSLNIYMNSLTGHTLAERVSIGVSVKLSKPDRLCYTRRAHTCCCCSPVAQW